MSTLRDGKVRRAALAAAQFEDDGGKMISKCARCIRTKDLQVHHVVALADGGADVVENTCVLCSACHREWHHEVEGHEDVTFSGFLLSVPGWLLIRLARVPGMDECSLGKIKQCWKRLMDSGMYS